MLAILTTHPIQYQVPIWKALAMSGSVPFEVWYLTDHGIRPTLDGEFGKTFTWDIDTLSGYPYRFIETRKGASPVTVWQCRMRERLRHRLANFKVKALWIQGWQVAAYWQAAREAKAVGVEVWLRAESNDLALLPLWKSAIKRIALGQLFSQVDRFLYIGTANKRLYQSFGVSQSRLYAAPYAVDNERFAKQAAAISAERTQLRQGWGIADDAFCALFCGKLIGKKRPMDLVMAARELRLDDRLPNIHLLFAGSGELGQSLRNFCNVVYDAERGNGPFHGINSSVVKNGPPASFAGFLNQTEISRAYIAADCLVLPSDHGETWGLVVNEALASGLPCLVSDACGCAEDLATEELSFAMGDVQALANKLVTLHSRQSTPKIPKLPSFDECISTISQIYLQTEQAA
jgi:glycosyltransferase involved in cell wall biosynthesis